jgi:hypothetical protein
MEWFLALDPKLAQAMILCLGALVTSGAAIYIAHWVYPVQKEKDRENEILRERRDLYRQWIMAVEQSRFAAVTRANIPVSERAVYSIERLQDLNALSQQLFVTAPDQVSEQCKAVFRHMLSMNRYDPVEEKEKFADAAKSVRETLEQTLLAMRKDTFGDTKATLSGLLPAVEFSLKVGKPNASGKENADGKND